MILIVVLHSFLVIAYFIIFWQSRLLVKDVNIEDFIFKILNGNVLK